jgi:hypothetical protein
VAQKWDRPEDNHGGNQNFRCYHTRESALLRMTIMFNDLWYEIKYYLRTLLECAATRAAALTRALELDNPEL